MIIDFNSVRTPALDVTQAALIPAGMRLSALNSLPEHHARKTTAFIPTENWQISTGKKVIPTDKDALSMLGKKVFNASGIVLPGTYETGRIFPYLNTGEFEDFELD